MQRIIILYTILIFFFCGVNAQTGLTIDLKNKGVDVSPTLNGIFFEDINHAADGGLYAELIRNRSFEDASTPDYWTTFGQGGALAADTIVKNGLLNSAQSQALKLSFGRTSSTARSGVYNTGFWGINIVKGEKYKVSFFAKCAPGFSGTVTASLESSAYGKYALDTIKGITTEWKKFTCTLTPLASNTSGRFVISSNSDGTIYLDVVSVFPPTFKNEPNGLRPDLAQLLVDLHPKFLRFPGGCFIEGDYLSNRFEWKKTVGPIEDRPGHWNMWGYRTSDGMGYYEYLRLCEDVGAIPLYVVNVGLSLNDYQPVDSLSGYIQDALDAIQYANGDTTTTYGKMRAEDGHPAPFNLKYIEIGNENYYGNNYSSRYLQFYNAIKAKYPNIQCIGNVAAWGTDNPTWTSGYPVDIVDEHYYRSPQWFVDQYHKYDTYSRTGPKVYVGEYAVTSNCGLGNLAAAVGEAVYMCGMEKNSDIVAMNSYAPIFVNVNDRTWSPDMIDYNASGVYCTPSYYVQKLFANNIGTVNINVQDSLNTSRQPITGSVGLGTWQTQTAYDDLSVTKPDGTVLLADSFNNASAWTPVSGTWTVSNGVYDQTSASTDCRSITSNITDSVYTYSVKAMKISGNEGFLIIFGYKDSNDFYWWNIGGWGNTQTAVEHCVNGTKSIVCETPGSVQTNVWYDIKIEVSTSVVKCYLDGQLIQSFTVPSTSNLYTSATLDQNKNELYLKVVNPNAEDVQADLNFKDIAATSLNGECTVLTSGAATDENSLADPNKVVPVTTSINAYSKSFNYLFKANSVNIFKINTGGTDAVSTVKQNNFSIAPNPVINEFKVKSDMQGRFEMEVRNINGSLVLSKEVSNGSMVDVSGLVPGVYVLTANQGGNTQKMKMIVK